MIGRFRNACRHAAVGVLSATSLYFLIAGGLLVANGGSAYYVVAGIVSAACAVLLARRRIYGVYLYGALAVATFAWALWEVGLNYWGLVPRVTFFFALGLLVLASLPGLRIPEEQRRTIAWGARFATVALALAVSALLALAFVPHRSVETRPYQMTRINSNTDQHEWRYYGRTPAGTRYSPAAQITLENVRQLKVAWTFKIHDLPNEVRRAEQNTPLFVEGLLYICTGDNQVLALDPDTGREAWRFNPRAAPNGWLERCRGVGYHISTSAHAAGAHSPKTCASRIIGTTMDSRLFAVDARTGRPCPGFGRAGFVDLYEGMGDFPRGYYFQTSAPLVARDVVIVGGQVTDSREPEMPSGVIRAFHVETGELVWAWDPGNPAITRLPPPGGRYTPSTPNMWSTPAYDDELGLVFAPLGVAPYETDFWGGGRSAGAEKYSNSVVALDVETGRLRWHFQTVHHDLWDYDVSPQPALVDVPDSKGRIRKGLIQATKTGEIFLLDRTTGEPISPVEEKPVPQGGQHDDWTSLTQPYSVGMPSIGNERLVEADMWGATPFDQLWCRIQFRRARYEGPFTPITTEEHTLAYPNAFGGMNWGGVSVDEARGVLIVNDIRIASTLKLVRGDEAHARSGHGEAGIRDRVYPGTRYVQQYKEIISPLVGSPCNAPPWGTMTAIDLRSRKIIWQIPMGTARDGAGESPIRLPVPIGLPTLGGPLTTSTGLVFFAGTQDRYLRALSLADGAELWKERLPVGAQATPITYISNASGKQYVSVVAGGSSRAKSRGAYVVSFSLL